MGLFDSLIGVVSDVAEIAVSPVLIVAPVVRSVTKPVAEAADELVKGVEELLK